MEKQEESVELRNPPNEGGQVRATEDVMKKCLYSVHVVQNTLLSETVFKV